jgi:hypothetical protein
MSVHVDRVLDLGDDVLKVHGTIDELVELARSDPDDEGSELAERTRALVAFGWVSALEHHYPPAAYDDGGNLRLQEGPKGAPGDPVDSPRRMSKAERLAYCKRLLLEQNAPPAPAPQPVDLGISG